MSQPLRVAVLVSGSGTNLQALLDRFNGGADPAPARVTFVVASQEGIGAIDRARRAGVDVRVAGGTELAAALGGDEPDLVVLAGWLKLIPESVVSQYAGRMINIHPALLPSFGGAGLYGRRVHEAVIRSGARISGPTVHFVNEEYDEGAIIAQWPVPVMEDDDPERLAARVLAVEHRLLPAVVDAFAHGDVTLGPDGRCAWRRPWFRNDEFHLDRG
jgi:formyltetrahydrofolate-dependent phosphoribosylglycinamide formyltransferase